VRILNKDGLNINRPSEKKRVAVLLFVILFADMGLTHSSLRLSSSVLTRHVTRLNVSTLQNTIVLFQTGIIFWREDSVAVGSKARNIRRRL